MRIELILLLCSLPLLAVGALIEHRLLLAAGRPAYHRRETAASLGLGLGFIVMSGLFALSAGGIYDYLWQRRLFDIPLDTWWGLAILFIGVEFAYYWQHRFAHESRWFWASHAVHHSAQRLNFITSYRLGWTARLSGAFVFYLPLFWIGLHPLGVAGMIATSLLYQVPLHSELFPKLGWLEKVFNTPSHHRVHHAINTPYLDRNYGGVLIVFDRLFGTLAIERADEPCIYGLRKQLDSFNPVEIAFHEWRAMVADVKAAPTWRARIGHTFGQPGWRPDGKGETTHSLRQAERLAVAAESSAPISAGQN